MEDLCLVSKKSYHPNNPKILVKTLLQIQVSSYLHQYTDDIAQPDIAAFVRMQYHAGGAYHAGQQ